MKKLRCFLHRLRSLAKPEQNEQRLRAEIEEHLALQTAENLRAGLSPEEARRRAVLQFGGVEAIKESYRDQRGLPFFETLLRDIRHTVRRLSLSPVFTITTILTLALGIGATTSIFTLAHAVLMKSLPVAKPDELYRLGRESRCCFYGGPFTQDKEFALVSHDLYQYLRDHTSGFTELAAFSAGTQFFGARRQGFSDSAQAYPAEFVSSNYFSMFGIHPWTGRAFVPSDDRPGAPPVAVMSYRLWQQKYAYDPSVVGGIFTLNEKPYAVVGIAPPGFFGDQLRGMPPDFFLPLHLADPSDLVSPNLYWLNLIGRLSPGAHPGSIEAQMRIELQQWLRSHWAEMGADERAQLPFQTLYLTPGGAGITGMRDQYEHWLQILIMVSGFVLLIACANVAGLMLVRGMERRRQTSLSIALGAGASRVVRQALTESVLLAVLGGTAGLAVAFVCTRLILYFAFPSLPGLAGVPIDAAPSMPVLVFATAVSLPRDSPSVSPPHG